IISNWSLLVGQTILPFGKPFVKNYLPEEYGSHPQNWAVTQDLDGKIYFGNNEGVIEFDGEFWNKISITGLRSMRTDSNGKIYLGADNELGFLYKDSLGVTVYQSLVEELPEDLKDFYTILSIVFFQDDVYFIGLRSVFKFHNDKLVAHWLPETDFRFGFEVYGRIFLRQNEIGLVELKGDSIELLPGTEMFKEESVYFMLPYDGKSILIGTRANGLFLASNDEKFILTKFNTNIDEYLKTNTLYHGIQLPDKNYALVTNTGGVIIINKAGNFIQLFNKDNGLAGNASNYAYCDKDKNLWIASNNGVYYVETNTPVTFFDEETGIKDLAVVIKKYNSKIFAGTLQNLFVLIRKDRLSSSEKLPYCFVPVYNQSESYMDLKEIDNELICATRTEICIFKDGVLNSISQSFLNYLIYPSKTHFSRFYVGCGNGIKYFEKEKNNWIDKGYLVKTNGEVRHIHELQNGNLIFLENYKDVLRLRFSDDGITNVIVKEEIDMPTYADSLIKYQLFELTDLTILLINTIPFYFDDVRDKFLPAEFLNISQSNNQSTYTFFSGERKNVFYFASPNGMGEITQQSGQYHFEIIPFMRLPVSEPFAIFTDSLDHKLWISMPKGVFCYDYSMKKNYDVSLKTLIRKIIIGKDSVISPEKNATIEYNLNSVSFYFSLPFYENIEANEYSYFLQGFNKEWSDWSLDTKASYTNIPAGEYVFKVKSRNGYKIESVIAEYHFKILHPWYMMWYAYLLYMIIFILIIYLSIMIYGKQLKAKNIKLEKIIIERTAEINEKNLELGAQNKMITDSIHYAKHIQDAILPNPEELKTLFGDAFVFFLPRDIVSGDFYWFTQQDNKIFIAAGDCTGHGVPGSLMSMMGNTLLNEIVNEKKIFSPASIFNNLNNSVITLLNQNIDGELTREDGMDISLVCFNKADQTITISSANHKVIIVYEGTEQIISGDIYSIGGMFSDSAGYTDHKIQYKKGTTLYLFSDGFSDQFGGDENKKYMLSKFEKLLIDNSEKPMDKQLILIKNTFYDWKGDSRQIDDILVIGIKV
ncbi:MAG: SpoIIE family protein phosphatase, partial [Bacteroidota bacterium]